MPRHGVRLVARLDGTTERGASYRVEVLAAGGARSGRASIDESGNVELAGFEPDLSPALREFAVAQLRAVWRTSNASGGWPRRLSRWREVD